MKKTRRPGALLCALLSLAAATQSVGTEITEFFWKATGEGPGHVGDTSRWEPVEGVPVAPSGNGYENVTFAYSTVTTVLIPYDAALNNITFADSERPNYAFMSDSEGSTLGLNGNVSLTSGGNVNFGSSISLLLSETSHTIDIAANTTVTVSGNIYSEGEGQYASVFKEGAGTLVLGGQNTFHGGVTVQEGTLVLGSSSSGWVEGEDTGIYYSPVGTGTLKMEANTTLAIDGEGITLHNYIDLGCYEGTVTIATGSADLSLLGSISGTAGLTKTGSGTLTLAGNNSFDGDLYVSGGTLNLQRDHSAGNGALEFGLSEGSTVNFASSAPTIYGLEGESASDTINLAAESTLTIDQCVDTTFAGKINGEGSALVKDGSGTLTLTGNNSYSGDTTIAGGTLVAGSANAFGTGNLILAGGSLRVANGVSFSQPLDFSSASGTLAGNGTFNGLVTLGASMVLSPGNSPGTMTFAAGLTLTTGGSADIEINAITNNPGVSSDLVAVTGGALNLSGVSTGGYTLRIISLGSEDAPGAVSGFNNSLSYAWTIYQSTAPIDATKFQLDATSFLGQGVGHFFLSSSTNDLVLNFTPVPEPSTYALMALGLGLVGLSVWRKRRA